jgi:chorismate--pyruvate lyase
MNRHDWSTTLPDLPDAYAPWLRDHGSLTARIGQRCAKFSVQPVRSGYARIAFDESSVLNIPARQLAYSREVFLLADEQPVVFAHSACATKDLRGAWQAMRGLGNRSLGSLLFTHPLVARQPLHYQALRDTHPLYRRASRTLKNPPAVLYARRSLFTLYHAPLLVTEVFLPKIIGLRSEDSGLSENQCTAFNPILHSETGASAPLFRGNALAASIHNPRSSKK